MRPARRTSGNGAISVGTGAGGTPGSAAALRGPGPPGASNRCCRRVRGSSPWAARPSPAAGGAGAGGRRGRRRGAGGAGAGAGAGASRRAHLPRQARPGVAAATGPGADVEDVDAVRQAAERDGGRAGARWPGVQPAHEAAVVVIVAAVDERESDVGAGDGRGPPCDDGLGLRRRWDEGREDQRGQGKEERERDPEMHPVTVARRGRPRSVACPAPDSGVSAAGAAAVTTPGRRRACCARVPGSDRTARAPSRT
jgi:hypothetical protein